MPMHYRRKGAVGLPAFVGFAARDTQCPDGLHIERPCGLVAQHFTVRGQHKFAVGRKFAGAERTGMQVGRQFTKS